jgi:hypothetical protein
MRCRDWTVVAPEVYTLVDEPLAQAASLEFRPKLLVRLLNSASRLWLSFYQASLVGLIQCDADYEHDQLLVAALSERYLLRTRMQHLSNRGLRSLPATNLYHLLPVGYQLR